MFFVDTATHVVTSAESTVNEVDITITISRAEPKKVRIRASAYNQTYPWSQIQFGYRPDYGKNYVWLMAGYCSPHTPIILALTEIEGIEFVIRVKGIATNDVITYGVVRSEV